MNSAGYVYRSGKATPVSTPVLNLQERRMRNGSGRSRRSANSTRESTLFDLNSLRPKYKDKIGLLRD